jgi:hypothetical protein
MSFEQELQAFRRELPKLVRNSSNIGKFALIHNGAVSGIWNTSDEAIAAGYDRFGIEPFLVKEITEEEPVFFFSRRVTPCQ